MKKIAFILSIAMLSFCSCGSEKPEDIPVWDFENQNPVDPDDPDDPSDDPDADSIYPDKLKTPSDMVLLYGGSSHRNPQYWSVSTIDSYVYYADRAGSKKWLFDGFLCLEFMRDPYNPGDKVGSGVCYVSNARANDSAWLKSATKEDWQYLIDYYFMPNTGIDAIETSIEKQVSIMGAPKTKRKIIIGVPEPIKYEYVKWGNPYNGSVTKYWGKINDHEADFMFDSDRVACVKWYIDECVKAFAAKKYKYVELTGFYWVAESSTHTSSILTEVAKYLTKHNFTFNWIPYYTAVGWNLWESYGFNNAYLQPNYFFSDEIPASRLDDACKDAHSVKMNLEMEFDGNALKSSQTYRGNRLQDYMDAFRRNGVWKNDYLAYYQGAWAVHWLKTSSNEVDQALYHEFCEFVTTRPTRDAEE